jgi:hypothetical protein
MDIRDLYNCQEDSDVKIALKNGTFIYTHRVILKRASDVFKKMLNNKLRESAEGVITFPDESDGVVSVTLQHIYGMNPNLHQLLCDEWFELMYFAHRFDLAILPIMIEDIHPHAPFKLLILAASQLTQPRLLSKALHIIANKYIDDSIAASYEYIKGIARIDYDFALIMWRQWSVEKLDPFVLFMLNCKLCDVHAAGSDEANELIERVISRTDFALFDPSQLLATLQITHIASNPAYVQLITCIMQLSSRLPTKPQTRQYRRNKKGKPKN